MTAPPPADGSAPPAPVILLADDDEDDRILAADALAEAAVGGELRTVGDGAELMDYLLRRGNYAEAMVSPTPALVLLDWNMPRMDGPEALAAIRAEPRLRWLPVVVLTTSKDEADVLRSYELGVNSFVSKPVSFNELVRIMRALADYWFRVVRLPDGNPPPPPTPRRPRTRRRAVRGRIRMCPVTPDDQPDPPVKVLVIDDDPDDVLLVRDRLADLDPGGVRGRARHGPGAGRGGAAGGRVRRGAARPPARAGAGAGSAAGARPGRAAGDHADRAGPAGACRWRRCGPGRRTTWRRGG